MFKKYLSIFILLFAGASFSYAQSDGIPERPNPPKLVNNLSKEMPDFLSQQETALLEHKLEAFANATSNQIIIVIVDDYGGNENFDFASRLGDKWGIGQSKMDNGIVILVKPTGGKGQRDLFIAPGKGLEGVIPDLTTVEIRENEMNPYLKKGENYTALDKGTDVLMALAKGEYNSDAYGQKHSKGKRFPKGLIIPIIFLILFIIIRSSKGGGGRGGMSMGSGFFLGSMMGRGFGGGGSSFGGGGSSGGFGGFGGGSFGGGGSGGSW